MKIQTNSPAIFPFHETDKVFLDGMRVRNPHEAARKWEWSVRISPTAAKLPVVGHFPMDVAEAHYLLTTLHAVDIHYDHTPGVIDSTGFGPGYVNLRDGESSWVRNCALGDDFAPGSGYVEDAYFGSVERDGCKFYSSLDLNPNGERFVIIKELWIEYLVQRLNAFHRKGYPRR